MTLRPRPVLHVPPQTALLVSTMLLFAAAAARGTPGLRLATLVLNVLTIALHAQQKGSALTGLATQDIF